MQRNASQRLSQSSLKVISGHHPGCLVTAWQQALRTRHRLHLIRRLKQQQQEVSGDPTHPTPWAPPPLFARALFPLNLFFLNGNGTFQVWGHFHNQQWFFPLRHAM
jgi:hypothetical protein